MWKSTSELDYPEKYCVDLCEAPRHRADAIGDNVASMAWKLHAIEQTELRRKYRADGVGRPKFDFHTDEDDAAPRTYVIKGLQRFPPTAS